VALVIDDEAGVRTLAQRMLERMSFEVLEAPDGRAGVDLFRANADQICLVLLDMTMPHMDGAATFRELRRIREDVQVILMSGYNEQSAMSAFAGVEPAAFVQKPYRFEELRSVVRRVSSGERPQERSP
jgi:DNA-binding NtrC family response regulator